MKQETRASLALPRKLVSFSERKYQQKLFTQPDKLLLQLTSMLKHRLNSRFQKFFAVRIHQLSISVFQNQIISFFKLIMFDLTKD